MELSYEDLRLIRLALLSTKNKLQESGWKAVLWVELIEKIEKEMGQRRTADGYTIGE